MTSSYSLIPPTDQLKDLFKEDIKLQKAAKVEMEKLRKGLDVRMAHSEKLGAEIDAVIEGYPIPELSECSKSIFDCMAENSKLQIGMKHEMTGADANIMKKCELALLNTEVNYSGLDKQLTKFKTLGSNREKAKTKFDSAGSNAREEAKSEFKTADDI